ncbi:GAF and ANTAR domain-containing protein [Cellulomonas alba]|uniref:GAF and ANTAR domain-containing protein n=1 Tax=Cellulomonas alba TaxID=3053467 RepID=A0ABT7SCH2_9CELL|nr:GAF and ANTAR domain-containing protein [Cellulomonas alba]MDM7853831.1 GAF and ANTAR domain-containing protein [Cellulomonas alba]
MRRGVLEGRPARGSRRARAGGVGRGAGAGSTALTLGPSEAPAAVGYAGELAARLDANQLRCGEGPSLLAEQNDDVVISDDLLADARWPRLARIATGTTVRSVLVAPVRVDGRHAGLLTCCSSGPRAFGPGHRDAATTLATAAGSVLAGMFERDRLSALAVHLDLALVSRQEIDEAKGVVIAQRGCTPDEAFAHLAELSQRENVKLRVIAHRIVVEAALPDDVAPTRWRAHGRRAT